VLPLKRNEKMLLQMRPSPLVQTIDIQLNILVAMGPIIQYHILWTFTCDWPRVITFLILVALRVCPEGDSVMDIILSITLYLNTLLFICVRRVIHISWDILLPIYMYLLYILDGTATDWMKSLVFTHLTQLPSNPILFGFGQLDLRCDFSKTKIQPLT
jgi:hypothetical protein